MSEAIATSTLPPEGLPRPDELLHDPVKLREIVTNPQSLYERVKGPDEASTELGMELDGLRHAVMSEIIAPEGLVEASRVLVEGVAQNAEPLINAASRFLGQVETDVTAALDRADGISSDVSAAKQVLQQVRDFIDRGNAQDIEPTRYAVNRLRNLQESYARIQRDLTTTYDEAGQHIRVSQSRVGETAELAGRGSRDLRQMQDQALGSPDTMYAAGTEEKVVARGARSIGEHKAQCFEEAEGYDGAITTIKQGSEQVSEGIYGLMVRFGRAEMVQALPNANRLNDAIDFLSSSIYKIGEYGPQMKRIADEAWHEVQGMVVKIEQGIHHVQAGGRQDAKLAADTQKQAMELGRKIQETSR